MKKIEYPLDKVRFMVYNRNIIILFGFEYWQTG